MFIEKLTILALVTLSVSNIVGCSTMQGSKSKEPKPIDVIILSTSTINPDLNSRPSPLSLNIYQMKRNELFSDLNYFELMNSIKLQEDTIEKKETMIQPDSLEYLSLKMTDQSKFVGVVASFRDIDTSEWRLNLLRQPETYSHAFENYLYLKVDGNMIQQLSKNQMKSELASYHKKHPEDVRVSKYGKFKKPKADYSKGIFLQK